MIYIEEQEQPYKLPGKISFFVKFKYQPNIVDTIKTVPNAVYHKKFTSWEIPVTSLSRAIDSLIDLDEITIKFQSDKEEKAPLKEIKLNKKNYKTKPFDHQEKAVEYGLQKDKWLLLDAPGLGKTLSMILLAQELKEREGLEHCFIICGVNTLKHNWKREIEQHSNLSCRILGQRINRKGKLVIGSVKDRLEELKKPIDEFFIITNVETLRDDDIVKALKSDKHNKIDMIVADEMHVMKSPTSQQGKNFLKLNTKYQIGLTGTLLLNSPMDAYVPLKWIGADNSTYTNFKFYYCHYTGMFNNILVGYKNMEVLKDMLQDISLRRIKDILNLPKKTIIPEFVEMDIKQERFYDEIINGITKEVDKVDLNTSTLLAMVTRLRQATADPSILSSNENIESAKINRAVDLAKQILSDKDEKVVIFSNFKKPLDKVMEELSEFNPLLCTGDIKDEEVDQNIYNFQNSDKNRALCATISKMGVGITLTRASYAIFMDSSWTAGVNQQAEDRIHRIGSDDPVFIYYLWTEGTIDERVKEIVEDKEALSDFIIDDQISKKSIESLRKFILDLKA